MTFERSKFGDGSATGAGNVTTAVNNHFGPRTSEKVQGITKTEGNKNQLTFQIDGTIVGDGAFPLLAPTIPAGALITRVTMNVTKAFVLGGTSPVIEIGTEGSEATNGFTTTEAQGEGVKSYNLTSALSGTWAAGLVADTTVGIALAGGGANTVTAAGEATVVIEYVLANT